MLKPPDRPVEDGADRDFGDLVHQLIEDAKGYARAEVYDNHRFALFIIRIKFPPRNIIRGGK